MKLLSAALCLVALFGTPALGETCRSTGDPKARAIGIPAPTKDIKDMMAYAAWTWLLADELDAVRPDRLETCTREPFRLGTQEFRLSGEDGEPMPRKAVSVTADGPVAMLVPFNIQRMRKAFPGLAPNGKTPFYMIVVLDDGVLTVERVLQGIPTDERLIGDLGLALTKVNTMARRAPGDKQAGIVLKAPDDAKGKSVRK